MNRTDRDPDNLGRFKLMRPYVSGQANLNPVKRIQQLRRLLNTRCPKVCIIRGEGIGDVLMTTPTVETLKNIFPEPAHVTYATNTRYLDGALSKVLRYNPSVDAVIDRELIDEGDYDLVVNLHCPCVAYEKRENPPKNRIDLFAEHTGVSLIDKLPKYYIQEEEKVFATEYLKQYNFRPADKTILVHIFSTAARRNLDSYQFKHTLKELVANRYKPIILTHHTDAADSNSFQSIPGISLAKDLDVRQIGALISQVNLVLCPDSAILHLAGAIGTPTVSLFGHTDPRARINYYKNTVAIWPAANMSCSRCWNLACQFNNACYKAITSDMIVSACKHILK